VKLIVAHRERLVREALRRSLARGRFELMAQAGDLESLKNECRKQSPQLLLVELELLGDKAGELPELLRCGTPVIALAATSAVSGGYEAMGLGALGLIEPPALGDDGELIGAQNLLSRMEKLVGIVPERPQERKPRATAAAPATQVPILAIGASTGGPLALARVLGELPAGFEASVLIVQHIEGEFSDGLAEWLAGQCRLPVSLARRGGSPEPGRIHVAGPGGHLVLTPSFHFGLQQGQPGELHVPSINALFRSLAQHAAPGAAAILTGMGSDGAAGMGELQRRGWYTVAQDEDSSVVYGMPRAAVELGAARQSLALNAIGPALVRHFRRRGP
jgi:two-component system response regulator WspF